VHTHAAELVIRSFLFQWHDATRPESRRND
jgi:hypothetical protein